MIACFTVIDSALARRSISQPKTSRRVRRLASHSSQAQQVHTVMPRSAIGASTSDNTNARRLQRRNSSRTHPSPSYHTHESNGSSRGDNQSRGSGNSDSGPCLDEIIRAHLEDEHFSSGSHHSGDLRSRLRGFGHDSRSRGRGHGERGGRFTDYGLTRRYNSDSHLSHDTYDNNLPRVASLLNQYIRMDKPSENRRSYDSWRYHSTKSCGS